MPYVSKNAGLDETFLSKLLNHCKLLVFENSFQHTFRPLTRYGLRSSFALCYFRFSLSCLLLLLSLLEVFSLIHLIPKEPDTKLPKSKLFQVMGSTDRQTPFNFRKSLVCFILPFCRSTPYIPCYKIAVGFQRQLGRRTLEGNFIRQGLSEKNHSNLYRV